jgi:hypothetical protein
MGYTAGMSPMIAPCQLRQPVAPGGRTPKFAAARDSELRELLNKVLTTEPTQNAATKTRRKTRCGARPDACPRRTPPLKDAP